MSRVQTAKKTIFFVIFLPRQTADTGPDPCREKCSGNHAPARGKLRRKALLKGPFPRRRPVKFRQCVCRHSCHRRASARKDGGPPELKKVESSRTSTQTSGLRAKRFTGAGDRFGSDGRIEPLLEFAQFLAVSRRIALTNPLNRIVFCRELFLYLTCSAGGSGRCRSADRALSLSLSLSLDLSQDLSLSLSLGLSLSIASAGRRRKRARALFILGRLVGRTRFRV